MKSISQIIHNPSDPVLDKVNVKIDQLTKFHICQS